LALFKHILEPYEVLVPLGKLAQRVIQKPKFRVPLLNGPGDFEIVGGGLHLDGVELHGKLEFSQESSEAGLGVAGASTLEMAAFKRSKIKRV